MSRHPTSTDLVGAALQTPDLRPTDKLVLVTLAWHQQQMGTAFPSEKRLGQLVGRKERAVRDSIKRLADRDLLTKTRRRRQTNLYTVLDRQFLDRQPTATDMSVVSNQLVSKTENSSKSGNGVPVKKQRGRHRLVAVREFGRRTTPVAKTSPRTDRPPSLHDSPAASRPPSNQNRSRTGGVIGGVSLTPERQQRLQKVEAFYRTYRFRMLIDPEAERARVLEDIEKARRGESDGWWYGAVMDRYREDRESA